MEIKTQKIFIKTFGCQMNEHDSQRILELFENMGYESTSDPKTADVVLVNTCSVRANPENKVYSYVGSLASAKKRNPDMVIGVCGCVAQQEGKKILSRQKVVDLVFGPDYIFEIEKMLKLVKAGKRVLRITRKRETKTVEDFIPDEGIALEQVHHSTASIAIMKGCDNFCSYCIVPYTRGKEISRTLDSILYEARQLVEKGAKEIMLLGQNVNSYNANGVGFYGLLKALSEVEGLRRIRFMSPHPRDWNDDLTRLMATTPNICNSLHLPFQAGADSVLKAMRRNHTIEAYLEKIRYLRKLIPDVEITSDLIVGFPGETREDFMRTLDVLQQVQFASVFAFKYSVRPGTLAAKLKDDVSVEEKQWRLAQVLDLQREISLSRLDGMLGRTCEVFVESYHPKYKDCVCARTDNNFSVMVHCPEAEIGDFFCVKITDKKSNSLQGTRL